MKKDIVISGARTHNLQNISLEIPKEKIVVFTGVSGSGKSSLLFDTIYCEAQRQLIETFSSFARSRMPKLSKPDVDEIRNISTAIVIDQKKMGRTLRSTVGTATELSTYMRLLYSRCGDKFIGPSFLFGFNHPSGMCPSCNGLGKQIRVDVDRLISRDKTIRQGAINHPDYKLGGWNWREMVAIRLFDVDKPIAGFSEKELHDFLYTEGIPVEKSHGAGTYTKNYEGVVRKLERLHLGKAADVLSASRKDAYEKYFIYADCTVCGGTRLNELARSVRINGKSIDEVSDMELTQLDFFIATIDGPVARPVVNKMRQILSHLIDIGVGYLSLNRAVATLSGGESQRVKMARQLDCDLVDMMYILDEPSIGLHPRDTEKLIHLLKQLRDKGNSVLVVEHDPEIIRAAEWIVDIGPLAGSQGGKLVYNGLPEGISRTESITGKYLSDVRKVKEGGKPFTSTLKLKNLTVHNLKNISTEIPVGVLTCVTGVAGSGKSSLVNECFARSQPDAIVIDQTAAGTSIRSNPATFTGVFDLIRKEFARVSGSEASLFSFNSRGACPKCNGKGFIELEMHFLDAIKITCDECSGQRYKEEILQLKYKDKSIYDVLKMTVRDGYDFFEKPEIKRRLKVLMEVGLGYLEIGQPLSTLSGGEAQRIKLAAELQKKGNIYIMDEPTTGLHMADIDNLIRIIKRLVDNNNTVVVIEHNLDIIKHADWIIDMGPEGGVGGGQILFEGRPGDLIRSGKGYTGKYLENFVE